MERDVLLYHGTNAQFHEINLSYAKGYKDFGRGFYLTSNLEQAQRWAMKKGRDANSYIYAYQVSCAEMTNLKVLELLEYNREWIDFIVNARIRGCETNHDIIYDRIADNAYRELANALLRYSKQELSAEAVISKAKWTQNSSRMQNDQFCFKTERAIALLIRQNSFVMDLTTGGKAVWRLLR